MVTAPTNEEHLARRTLIKIGGAAHAAERELLQEVADLHRSTPLVLVHGCGKEVSRWLGRLQIMPHFVQGVRRTDAATLEVVMAVLGGVVNNRIVAELKRAGAEAIGLSGAALVSGRMDPDSELGYVATSGTVEPAARHLLAEWLADRADGARLPVIAPLARNAEEGDEPILNINADTMAGVLAGGLGIDRLVLVTDQPGVLDRNKRLIPHMTYNQAQELVRSGVAIGGMVPKIEACLVALHGTAASAHIVGTDEGDLRRVLNGERAGTAIARTPRVAALS